MQRRITHASSLSRRPVLMRWLMAKELFGFAEFFMRSWHCKREITFLYLSVLETGDEKEIADEQGKVMLAKVEYELFMTAQK